LLGGIRHAIEKLHDPSL
jgi:hypothetical protein